MIYKNLIAKDSTPFKLTMLLPKQSTIKTRNNPRCPVLVNCTIGMSHSTNIQNIIR